MNVVFEIVEKSTNEVVGHAVIDVDRQVNIYDVASYVAAHFAPPHIQGDCKVMIGDTVVALRSLAQKLHNGPKHFRLVQVSGYGVSVFTTFALPVKSELWDLQSKLFSLVTDSGGMFVCSETFDGELVFEGRYVIFPPKPESEFPIQFNWDKGINPDTRQIVTRLRQAVRQKGLCQTTILEMGIHENEFIAQLGTSWISRRVVDFYQIVDGKTKVTRVYDSLADHLGDFCSAVAKAFHAPQKKG